MIGQGTAAVAGQSMADVLAGLLGRQPTSRSRPSTATEFSGFGMRHDLRDTLVVAVSQSGTTTDTNRTVDLARGRGASVIGIVNRRNSDLTDKAHGVLYTSDGRDVEMCVASTKAFYAQVAAGALLACAIAEPSAPATAEQRHRAAGRAARAARRHARGARAAPARSPRRPAGSRRRRRYWAVVGNGPNRVAAEEVRIKLSELCYKSIACDVTEDKKHIDLSSEPLILVCAAGLVGLDRRRRRQGGGDLPGPQGGADRHRQRGRGALQRRPRGPHGAGRSTRRWPSCCRPWSATCSATRRRWPSTRSARPLREAREAIEAAVADGAAGDVVLARLRDALAPRASHRFSDGLRTGTYDGHLEASTAVRVTSLLRYAHRAAARSTRTSSSTARSARPRCSSTTSRRRSRGPSRS